MSSARPTDQRHSSRALALLESVRSRISTHLEAEQHRIYGEIKNYPTPIAGCDQQFNYLLEKQAGIARELERMREAADGGLCCRDSLKLLDEFIRSSGYLDDQAKQRMTTELKQRPAEVDT